MRAVALILLTLALPGASAGALDLVFEDPAGDVITPRTGATDRPSADILAFESTVIGDRLVERIRVGDAPMAPTDSILVRNWFRAGGVAGSVEMEIRGGAPTAEQRFRAEARIDRPENVTPVADATWHVDGASWVFTFPASLIGEATCFEPSVFTQHVPREQAAESGDRAHAGAARCRPVEERPPSPLRDPTQTTAEPSRYPDAPLRPGETPAPPGADVPAPAWWVAAMAAVALAAARRR